MSCTPTKYTSQGGEEAHRSIKHAFMLVNLFFVSLPMRVPPERLQNPATGDPGNVPRNVVEWTANVAKRAACTLYRNYPGYIESKHDTSPDGLYKHFLRELCEDEGLPPPPPTPGFTGGQCPVTYRVYYYYRAYHLGNCNVVIDINTYVDLMGPIGGVVFVPTGGSTNTDCFGGVNGIRLGNVNITHGTSLSYNIAQSAYEAPGSEYGITNVVRLDGLPDNCGDAGGGYPVDPPPATELTTVVNIEYGDTNQYNLDLTLVYAPISAEVNAPINFQVDGLNFTLDFGGINITNADDQPYLPSPDSPRFLPRNPTSDLDRFRDIIDDIADILDPLLPGDDDMEETPRDETDEMVEEDDVTIEFIRVTLTVLPPRGRVALGTTPDQSRYEAGWVQLRVDGQAEKPILLETRTQIFRLRPEHTGYSVQFINGASGVVTEFRKTLEPE